MEPVVGYPLPVTERGLTAMAYDGMWALALGLHHAESELGRPLDSFEYEDTDYADVVGRCVRRQKFQGVSVGIMFNLAVVYFRLRCIAGLSS